MKTFFVFSLLGILFSQSASAQQSKLPAGPLKIVALGDSLTEGDGDDGNGGYPARLVRMISKNRPGSTIVNLGKSGWSSDALIQGDQGLPSQLTQAEKLNAQVALVWIGSNDLWYLYEYNNGTAADDAADVGHFSGNIDTILKRLKKTGAALYIALLDDQTRRPIAKKTGSDAAFTGISGDEMKRMSSQVTKYNDVIRKKAAQYGAGIVDFSKSKVFESSDTLADDGNHPNGRGYDQVAQSWYQAIQSQL